jgi:RHS repeat-associated protein
MKKVSVRVCLTFEKALSFAAVNFFGQPRRIAVKHVGFVLFLSLGPFSSATVYYELSGASNAVTVTGGDTVEYGYATESTANIIIPVTWADSIGAKFYVDEHYPDGSVFRRSALYGVQQVGTTSRKGSFVFTKGSIMLPYRSEIPVYDFYHKIPAAPAEPSNDCEDGSTADPIDTRNGNNYFTEKRIFVPCPGVFLELDLTYQSIAGLPTGMLGEGWRHSLEWSLDVQTNQAVLYTGDGKKRVFGKDGDTYLSPFGKNWTLGTSASGYEMCMPGGLYYDFDPSGVLTAIHDAWGNAVELVYGTNACLEYATHSNGRQIAFSNAWHATSGQWRVSSISATDGMLLAFDYNGDGQFTQVVEHVGVNSYTSSYHYADSFLTNRIDGAGFEYSYGYATGTNGLLNGMGTRLNADGFYNHTVDYILPDLTEVRYPLRGTEQIYRYYRNRNGVLSTKYGPGESVSNAVRHGINYSYSENNEDRVQMTLFDNTTNASWSKWMLYDEAHNITNFSVGYGTTQPTHQLSIEYDPVWQLPSSLMDAEGNRTEINYTNALPLKVKVFHSASNSYDTCFGYTTNGLLKSFTNANGHVTVFDYDNMGNLTGVAPETGPAVTNTYTALGFLKSSETLTQDGVASGRIIRYGTDPKGRVLQVIHPDGLAASFAYNALGYLTNTIDRFGRTTDFAYAPAKQLKSITRYLNENGSNTQVRIGYDLDRQMNLLRITEPRGRYVESYKLDIRDRITSVTNIEDQVMSIGYTIGDFIDQVTRFDNSIIEYAYDNAGRESLLTYLDGSRTNAVIECNYFANSQLESMSDGFSSISNSYDRLNRLTRMAFTAGTSWYDSFYSYDPAGNVTNSSIVCNKSSNIDIATEFTYDEAERLRHISRTGIQAQNFVYSYSPANGLPSLVSNTVAGITCSYKYDLMDRITNITYRAGDGTVIHACEYDYNAVGMIERKSISRGSGFTSVAYAYDSLDRLVYESGTIDDLPAFSKRYSYDLAGNRLSRTADGLKTTYTPGSGNRLSAASTAIESNTLFVSGTANEPIGTDNRWGELWITNLTIGAGTKPSVNGNSFFAEIPVLTDQTNTIHAAIRDRAGNMSYAVNDYWVGVANPTNETQIYTYNAAGCLTNIQKATDTMALNWDERYRLTSVASTTSTISYTYDILGRRTSRTEGSITNYYVYDGQQVVADLDGDGKLLRTYVWGMGIDNLLSMTVYTNGMAQTSATYFAIKDHQNTVIAMTDSTGSIVESYEYDAYGKTTIRDAEGNTLTESEIGCRYLFQGREYDASTGHYYFRARWYQPDIGRWLSKDPVGIAGGLNLYEAFRNNPVNAVDPSGLDVAYLIDWDVLGGAGHGAAAVGNDDTGWTYYSFGPGSDFTDASDNLDIKQYDSFQALLKENSRYNGNIRYPTSREADCAAHAEATSRIGQKYNLFSKNCDDIAVAILQAAGIKVPDHWMPSNTFGNLPLPLLIY